MPAWQIWLLLYGSLCLGASFGYVIGVAISRSRE